MKLFGGTSGARTANGHRVSGKKNVKKRNPFRALAVILALILLAEGCYFFVLFTKNSFISYWRDAYIETAMDTLNHKWLATAIFPQDLIDEVMSRRAEALQSQIDKESTWGPQEPAAPVEPDVIPEETEPEDPDNVQIDMEVIPEEDPQEAAREAFYELFHEIDEATMQVYLSKHPEVLANGWENIRINEAGMDDEGTEIRTIHDEQVLAIDVPNKLLLVRVEGGGLDFYQGVLAICKDNTRLSLKVSSQLGVAGEYAGTIAAAHNGLLAVSASGYDDPDGNGNGGLVAGYTMSDGVVRNAYNMGWGFKRLELHEDNLLYIKDASSSIGEGTTDAMEFQPALIIDGEIVVDANCGWTGLHPRSCVGQSDKFEILMLVIEGRMPTRSVGTHVIECAEILKRHGCMQAMNMDGGTSAIMWYDGEYITKCNNAALPSGRPMPNAWVYGKES